MSESNGGDRRRYSEGSEAFRGASGSFPIDSEPDTKITGHSEHGRSDEYRVGISATVVDISGEVNPKSKGPKSPVHTRYCLITGIQLIHGSADYGHARRML